MLRMVLKKMLRNRWLVICLLAGSIIAVALVSSIPTYTQGTLQRLLARDLERFQEQMNMYPGRYTLGAGFNGVSPDPATGFPAYDSMVRRRIIPALGLAVQASTNQITVDYLQAVPAVQREENPARRFVKIEAMEGAADHVAIQQGRIFRAPPPGTRLDSGEIEAVVSPQALVAHDLRVGEAYTVTDLQGLLTRPLTVRIVGTFTMRDPGDPWWFMGMTNYDDTLLTDYSFLRAAVADPPTGLLTGSYWSYALDYHAITVTSLAGVLGELERQIALLDHYQVTYDLPMLDILRQYHDREQQILSVLWFLQIPVLLMLAFYVYMVSMLIVDAERNEIAVLKSRGAGAGQLFLAYLAEGLIISAAALAAGPPLGLVVCRAVGAANGFLQFVQRAGLRVELTGRAYLYGALSAGLMMGAMLVPAMLASRTTIVLYKQRRALLPRPPAWRRFYLDVLLVAVAGYGYYGYRTRHFLLLTSGLKPSSLPMDPLLFLISTFFVIGVGLLFLRFYPLAVRFLFRVGRRAWPPGLYATLSGVGRSGGREQFLMLFLIMTLAIGILNAKAARTINRNMEDTIAYTSGADLTLQEEWPSNLFKVDPTMQGRAVDLPRGDVTADSSRPVEYHEPDFSRYTSLPGIQGATRVFRRQKATVNVGTDTVDTYLMGIEPAVFSEVAAFPAGLLPLHPNAYMNVLLGRPDALLVSQSFAEENHVKLGDALSVTWSGGGYLTGVVGGFVPWWPTYNPFTTEPLESRNLVVAGLRHVQLSVGVQPYEVWMKKTPGASSEDIYARLQAQKIQVVAFNDASQALVVARGDAVLQGTNGALTMGFIVTMIVSMIGFLIYWIISIQGRVLQFGVFRAMGLSRLSVLGMIASEQALISLVAILAGITIGGVTGDLFVPLLELTRAAARQVPPFRVVAERADYVNLYVIVGCMLAVGLSVLGVRIMRIRMAQAIKLGEE
jgi:putative ABC transport system permease protein